MVKLAATFIALSTAASVVLAGYSQDTCHYSANDKGRYVYSCEESACNKSTSWVKEHFQKSMTDKGYDCRIEGDNDVSCYKPHDNSDPYSHNWNCSDDKEGWNYGRHKSKDEKHHDKRGYEDEHKEMNHHNKGKHHDREGRHHRKEWDHKGKHHENKEHHDKRGYEDEHKDKWNHKNRYHKEHHDREDRHHRKEWDHKEKHHESKY
ncbi:hypothetical protein BD560DRAFT_141009 [Blakeslea trispora]|nr:hypothetical protein BD560DRAFT_141009 [Blakeslea trispora]